MNAPQKKCPDIQGDTGAQLEKNVETHYVNTHNIIQAEPAAPWSFTAFEEYAAAGFHFVRIPRVGGKPSKGPRGYGWNLPRTPANPEGYTAGLEPVRAWIRAGDNIGLALLPSGVVSLDVDELNETRRVLEGLGLDLGAWFADPARVEIRSGKPGKAKLLFRVPTGAEPMPPSKKLTFGKGKKQKSIFEVRHGSADGATLQDVLPPSVHPDTALPYELAGDVRHMPELPPELLALWRAWPDVLKTFDPDFEAPKEKPRPKSAAPMDIKGERNPIAEFNAAHDLDSVLERHGYRRKGRRYLRPGSESGIPGLTILEGKGGHPLCYSHGGDDLNDSHAHDAFDVFRILECGGDWKKALAWNPELTAHNQRLFTEQKRQERRIQAAVALSLGSLYVIDGGRICKADGEVPAPLCNFTARIVEEVLTDDGEASSLSFHIAGRLGSGQTLPTIEVPAERFAGMSWVTGQWGIRACINAGQSSKDHIRAALQELSGDVPRRTVYAHTGWRKIDDVWRYLHAGGALGETGNRADVEVNPGPGNMGLYRLPDPPEGAALADAVRASLKLLELAPHKLEIGALLLAVTYRAPLAHCAPIDHAALLFGYTGARKSEAAALILSHFG
ncbi:bifunctional DNA primase/polymerase [Methylomagnum sp.]